MAKLLLNDDVIKVQANLFLVTGLKVKINRAFLELSLKILAGEKGGRVLSTFVAQPKSGVMY